MILSKDKLRWTHFLAGLFAFVWLGLVSYRYISPSAWEGRSIFRNLSNHDVVSLSIEPARYGYPSLVRKVIVVKDKKMISSLAEALSNLPEHSPEHPRTTRAVIIRIKLKDRVLGGYLEDRGNDGATFYYMSGVSTGWCFATYRVPNDRHVFDLVEEAIKESAN